MEKYILYFHELKNIISNVDSSSFAFIVFLLKRIGFQRHAQSEINKPEMKISILIALCSNLRKIFRLRGSTKCLRGPIFRGWNEILLLGKALKFGVIFQKYALTLIKNWKNWENSRKNANFLEYFLIFGGAINF